MGISNNQRYRYGTGNVRDGLNTGVQFPSYNTGRTGSQDGGREATGTSNSPYSRVGYTRVETDPSSPVNTSQVRIGGVKGGVKSDSQSQVQPSGNDRLKQTLSQSSEMIDRLKAWDDERTAQDYTRMKDQQQATWNREDAVSNRNAALAAEDRRDVQTRSRNDSVFEKNINQTNPFDMMYADAARGDQLGGFLASVDRVSRQSENLANYLANQDSLASRERIQQRQNMTDKEVAQINNQNNWTKYRIDQETNMGVFNSLANVYGQIPRR